MLQAVRTFVQEEGIDDVEKRVVASQAIIDGDVDSIGGLRLAFFGHEAATYTTAAMLHLVARAPLCFAACRRVGPKRFELWSSPLIQRRPSGDKKADVRAILAEINGHLEAAIRRDPDQYLWGHRRWRE